jgi:hypothetical protein
MEHTRGFLVRLCGGAQFKEGTALWETKKVGMMPPPNFGRHFNRDRFDPSLRCLGRGPEGYEASCSALCEWTQQDSQAGILLGMVLHCGRNHVRLAR